MTDTHEAYLLLGGFGFLGVWLLAAWATLTAFWKWATAVQAKYESMPRGRAFGFVCLAYFGCFATAYSLTWVAFGIQHLGREIAGMNGPV